MMILRPAKNRGHNRIDWLNSYHTFSFGDYYDEKWMRFGVLRVINEDFIQPSKGFGMHAHRDMEIITYVISGALKHQDSMGNGSVILPGEIQKMSAGEGVKHSEFNHSDTQELHLLQIWILPEQKGIKPAYEQKKINKKLNQLILMGSNQPNSQAVTINQNINIFVGFFTKDNLVEYSLHQNKAWLQLIKGRILVNKQELNAGDGIGIHRDEKMVIECLEEAEFLLLDGL